MSSCMNRDRDGVVKMRMGMGVWLIVSTGCALAFLAAFYTRAKTLAVIFTAF
jgi:hypothetical protein